jgi:hypothetical protein
MDGMFPAHRPKALPSREDLVHRTRERLLARSLPRLQMSGLLALTGAAGFLTSFSLLELGVDSMAVRYPVAVIAAYAVFLLLLRVWLWMQRDGSWDAGDLVDWTEVAVDGAGAVAEGLGGLTRGGGSFGGGGTSASFEAPRVPIPRVAAPKSGGGGGKGFGFSLDLDEGGIVVLIAVLILAVAALGTALWVVWSAPVLLAEVLVDGLVLTGLYRRLRRGPEPTYWLLGAVRRTWLPALVAAALFCLSGWMLQKAVPEARSIGPAVKAVSSGEERP